MGLRGYKASTGINCTFCTTDFTRFTYLLLTSQVLGSLFYAYYVFVRLCIPQFRTISVQIMDLRANVLCIFNSILPGQMVFFVFLPFIWLSWCRLCSRGLLLWNLFFFAGVLVLFLAFFAFLHCWLNAFAEMLRFADRMFYKVHLLSLSPVETFKCLSVLFCAFHFFFFFFTGLVEFNIFC